ncbi:MAG: hypothetical protein ACI4M9_07880 [Succinivibrio sp.]
MSEYTQEMDEKELLKKSTEILGELAAKLVEVAAAGIAMNILKSVTVTNSQKSTVAGDKTLRATNEETTLEESKVEAAKTDSSLAKDEVSGENGSVDALETNAKAATTEATAAEAGAQAVKTKAGACDIQTKGLKLN